MTYEIDAKFKVGDKVYKVSENGEGNPCIIEGNIGEVIVYAEDPIKENISTKLYYIFCTDNESYYKKGGWYLKQFGESNRSNNKTLELDLFATRSDAKNFLLTEAENEHKERVKLINNQGAF